jgi:hypothetical protein
MLLPLSHDPIVFQGTTFDLSHLNAFGAAILKKGMIPGTDLAVVVVFSNHVFTARTPRGHLHHIFDHHGTRRSFDPDRYAMSTKLPTLLKSAIEKNDLTFISRSYGGTDNLILLPMEDGRT